MRKTFFLLFAVSAALCARDPKNRGDLPMNSTAHQIYYGKNSSSWYETYSADHEKEVLPDGSEEYRYSGQLTNGGGARVGSAVYDADGKKLSEEYNVAAGFYRSHYSAKYYYSGDQLIAVKDTSAYNERYSYSRSSDSTVYFYGSSGKKEQKIVYSLFPANGNTHTTTYSYDYKDRLIQMRTVSALSAHVTTSVFTYSKDRGGEHVITENRTYIDQNGMWGRVSGYPIKKFCSPHDTIVETYYSTGEISSRSYNSYTHDGSLQERIDYESLIDDESGERALFRLSRTLYEYETR